MQSDEKQNKTKNKTACSIWSDFNDPQLCARRLNLQLKKQKSKHTKLTSIRAGDWKHKVRDFYHVCQVVESQCKAVFSSWGLLVVSQHQLPVLLPHCPPENGLRLKHKHRLSELTVYLCVWCEYDDIEKRWQLNKSHLIIVNFAMFNFPLVPNFVQGRERVVESQKGQKQDDT